MRIGGLASGIDTDSIIKDLMKAERIPLDKMEQSKTKLEWQRDAYREINTLLFELDEMAFDLKLERNFNTKSFTSTRESAVIAKGGAGASDGNYSINVTELATSAMNIGAVEDIDQNLSEFAGVTNRKHYFYTIDEDGNVQAHDFTVNEGDTIRDVIKKINDDRDNNVRLFYDDMTNKVVMETTRTGDYNTGQEFSLNGNSLEFGDVSINKDEENRYSSVSIKNGINISMSNNNIQVSNNGVDNFTINFNDDDINVNGEAISLNGKVLTYGEEKYEFNEETTSFDIDGTNLTFTLTEDGTFTINGVEVDLAERKLINEGQEVRQHDDQILIGGLAIGLNRENADNEQTVLINGKHFSWSNGTVEIDGDTPIENRLSGEEIIFGSENAFLTKVLNLHSGVKSEDGKGEVGGTNASMVYNDNYEVTSRDNNYSINGITFEFRDVTNGNVSINVQSDIDTTVEKITEFVDKYNEVIEKINDKLREPRHRDFPPLTEAQREEMEEREIELWEEKAKSGLLRGDAILSSTLTNLRQNWYTRIETGGTYNSLPEIGIKTTSDYMDGGKLEIDEDKLREALETDQNSVFKLFSSDNEGASRGILHRLEDTMDGAMDQIRKRAGRSTDSTLESYTLGKRMKDVEDRMAAFEDRLKQIEDRYWRQFGEMERAISMMNQQSMMLMSSFMPQ